MECQSFISAPSACQEGVPKSNVLSAGTVQPVRRKSDDERRPKSKRLTEAHTRPGLRPADRRLIFSAQCRLLATRAENGLPVDIRSFLNLIRSFRELLIAGAAQ